MTIINTRPQLETSAQISLEQMYQVILFNDDINDCEYVVECLISIFNHPLNLAVKIMIEAHECGRAIAEVESKTLALQHTAALLRAGLNAKAEAI
jgi:ATP-dependent Clp protease adapter protein ClpS